MELSAELLIGTGLSVRPEGNAASRPHGVDPLNRRWAAAARDGNQLRNRSIPPVDELVLRPQALIAIRMGKCRDQHVDRSFMFIGYAGGGMRFRPAQAPDRAGDARAFPAAVAPIGDEDGTIGRHRALHGAELAA